jgi:putative ABC transport system permease protein
MKQQFQSFIKYLKLTRESLVFAFHAVVVNRLRTLLSLLGITIGIFAIISVFTVIDSLVNNIKASVSALGDNIIYVQKWPWTFGPDYPWWEYMKRPVPKLSEYEEIVRKSNFAEAACFSASTQKTVKFHGKSVDNVGIWMNTQEFPEIRSFELQFGRYFTLSEEHAGRPVAIIGKDVADKLFQQKDPLNNEIILSGRKITVIGIAAKEGSSMLGGGSLDNMVLLPMNYGRTIFDVKEENMNPFIMVKAKPTVNTQDLKDELSFIMRSARRVRPRETDNFALNQSSMITKGLESIFAVLNFAGWFIGGFSILVGGFGIANIMFVSVKERTNIIGIQKAMGAKKYFIMYQFLFESVLLAITGGLIGLLLVFGGTLIVTYGFDFKISLTLSNIIMGISISAIIGIIAGYIPAYTASRLDPVKAIATTF